MKIQTLQISLALRNFVAPKFDATDNPTSDDEKKILDQACDLPEIGDVEKKYIQSWAYFVGLDYSLYGKKKKDGAYDYRLVMTPKFNEDIGDYAVFSLEQSSGTVKAKRLEDDAGTEGYTLLASKSL